MKIPVFSFLLSLILSVLAAISPLEAQESLVPNGDFEEYIMCPSGLDLVQLAKPWYQANQGSSDYFNSCALIESGVSTPENFTGKKIPYSGNAYAGFGYIDWANLPKKSRYYEYLTVRLVNELKKNEDYCIKFQIALGDTFCNALNHVQIYLSKDSIFNNSADEAFLLKRQSQIKINLSEVNSVNWYELSINYTGRGGEQFLSIGIFDTMFTMNNIRECKDLVYLNSTYYLIDNVSIIKNTGQCPLVEIPNVFTPNQDGINDFFLVDGDNRLMVQNRWGQVLFIGESSKGWDGKWNDREMATGVYFYVLTDEKDNTKTGYFHLWR